MTAANRVDTNHMPGGRNNTWTRRTVIGLVALLFGSLGAPAAQAAALAPDGVLWTTRTPAANNAWYGLAYGNGLFVAVSPNGAGNQVMTSPDGITWTSRTSPTNAWFGVAYGNGLFVAVAASGSGNRVMTSPNGITWTSRASAADNEWHGVTYGNGLFVAVARSGTGNRVMTSPDGITWTARTSPANNVWNEVTYGNGLFVAVAWSGSGNRVMTSPDGITWTARTSPDNEWFGVTYGNGLFVAVGRTGSDDRVMTSPDGITWTPRTSAANSSWHGVTYGNGLFVAVGGASSGNNRVMTSPDGITWTLRQSAVANAWVSLAYGNGMFVAGSHAGSGNGVMTNGSFGWTDPTVPETRLDAEVPSYVSADSVTLRFGSDLSSASFECRVDNGSWATCVSPAAFTLDEGVHSISVRAVSSSGVVDSTPLVVSVVIDRTAPVTVIDQASVAGSLLPSVTTDPGFDAQLRASESGARFECQLDGGVWTDCGVRPRYEGLLAGAHSFTARAIDRAGNVGPATAARRWELRGARNPISLIATKAGRSLRCASGDITDVSTIGYQWRRDTTPIPGATTDRYTTKPADDLARITCAATVTFASGTQTKYTSRGFIVMGKARIKNFTAPTTLKPGRPLTATFHSNKTHTVMIRLWCRSSTYTCKRPAGPKDYLKPAHASYVPAGLTKYRKIHLTARPGTNTIRLNDYLPHGLPQGEYKLTIRLTHRNTARTLTTSNYLHQTTNITG